MMKQITVDHTWAETVTVDGAPVERERTVRLVLGSADLNMGMRRSLLIEEQRILWEDAKRELVEQDASPIELFAAELLRTQLYPNLVAAVVEQTGFEKWPVTYEEFMELPEPLGLAWERAVGDLNPHWAPQPPPETMQELEEARKKVIDGTSE